MHTNIESKISERAHPDRGIVALITIVIIAAVIMILGIASVEMSRTDIIMSGQSDTGRYVLSIASACAEEALYRVKLDTAYTGGTIVIEDETCDVTVSGSGANRTITATADYDLHEKTVEMEVTLRQNASGQAKAWRIDSWTEVDP
jgi:hypothetical protein